MEPGKLVRVHLSEADKYDGGPLYEAIVSLCRTHQISGATVFRGLEGFGEAAPIHRSHLIASDAPISVVIVDSAQTIDGFLPALEALVDKALIAVSHVQLQRIQKERGA
jgi:PII-like signaling protein